MKEFCFLCYTNGCMLSSHFFTAEDGEKALEIAKKEWRWPFELGSPWWLMEVKSSSGRGGRLVSV